MVLLWVAVALPVGGPVTDQAVEFLHDLEGFTEFVLYLHTLSSQSLLLHNNIVYIGIHITIIVFEGKVAGRRGGFGPQRKGRAE